MFGLRLPPILQGHGTDSNRPSIYAMTAYWESEALAIIQDHVYKRFENQTFPEAWRNLPEIPEKSEIMPATDKRPQEERWDDYQKDLTYNPSLPINIVDGPWPSKEEYIGAHYRILREDAIASLRRSVALVRADPDMNDNHNTCIYTFVHFRGFQFSTLGPAFRVEFSYERTGKRIRWEQSKRLQQGTLVALSPHSDMFKTCCLVAIVAARPIIGGLDQNPPQIDLFWGNDKDAVFDPLEPYVMVEARSGYFEASRYMLIALQKLMTEKFPLAKHLVNLDPDVGSPAYLEEQPFMNLTSLVPTAVQESELSNYPSESDYPSLFNVNVLEHFPAIPQSGMDESQMSACKRMLTKSVAIVQGPPGTGKTHTSVSAIRVGLDNMVPGDGPIIVAAQTNHALDQLLKHILTFEPNILRLGGRCDNENVDIVMRTLYQLRMRTKDIPESKISLKTGYNSLKNCINDIQTSLAPVLTEFLIMPETLLQHSIITQAQFNSLHEDGWVRADDPDDLKSGPIAAWLGPGQLVAVPRTPPINLGLEMEESDLEFEQQLELELESGQAPDEFDKEALRGTWVPLRQQFTGKHNPGISGKRVTKLLGAKENLYDIPFAMRGDVYRYFERQLYQIMLKQLHTHLVTYRKAMNEIQVTKWFLNIKLIRHLGIKLIGCTTTGLSKYRGLLSALNPRILLVEEAAETLEGTVIAGMFNSLDHLVLVGDHQQLQAHCNIRALEAPPYNLAVSMFERLVNNSISYTMLNKQRRMIPDVRKLLSLEPNPFYSNLQDHPSVLDRVPIPGMGGKNTYFFHHTWPESRNADSSHYNMDEAEMIAGFFNYLVLNGVEHSKITVLTFYNGQRKTVLKSLKKHPSLGPNTYFNVFTVDSYQGEENDVILLSLVRSNEYLTIGFLENKNRLVVALSRARRGLYIFGNAITLTTAETTEEVIGRDALWSPLINAMRDQGRFQVDAGLPITCSKHGKTISMFEPDDWHHITAGCDEKCGGELPCGHQCPHKCHPFDHQRVICGRACPIIMTCGHRCKNHCGQTCCCSQCEVAEMHEINAGLIHGQDVRSNIASSISNQSPAKDNMSPRKNNQLPRSRSVMLSQSPQKGNVLRADARNRSRGRSGPAPPQQPHKAPPFGSRGVNAKKGLAFAPIAASSSEPVANDWNAWNAEEADKLLAEQRRRLEATLPKSNPSSIVYNEIHRPVTVQDGVRIRDTRRNELRVLSRDPSSSKSHQSLPIRTSPTEMMPRSGIYASSRRLNAVAIPNDRSDAVNQTEKAKEFQSVSLTAIPTEVMPKTDIYAFSGRRNAVAIPNDIPGAVNQTEEANESQSLPLRTSPTAAMTNSDSYAFSRRRNAVAIPNDISGAVNQTEEAKKAKSSQFECFATVLRPSRASQISPRSSSNDMRELRWASAPAPDPITRAERTHANFDTLEDLIDWN